MKRTIEVTLTDEQALEVLRNAIDEDELIDDTLKAIAVGGLPAISVDEFVRLVQSAVNNGAVDADDVYGNAS